MNKAIFLRIFFSGILLLLTPNLFAQNATNPEDSVAESWETAMSPTLNFVNQQQQQIDERNTQRQLRFDETQLKLRQTLEQLQQPSPSNGAAATNETSAAEEQTNGQNQTQTPSVTTNPWLKPNPWSNTQNNPAPGRKFLSRPTAPLSSSGSQTKENKQRQTAPQSNEPATIYIPIKPKSNSQQPNNIFQ